jgi:predicted porin
MKRSILLSTAMVSLLALPAMAQDKENFAASGATGIKLKVSGQVNRALLFTDDGNNTEEFFVDNDNSSTRFRFTGSGDVDSDTSVGFNIEVQMESNSTAEVNQLDKTTGGDSFTERKLELYIDSDRLGRVTLGQGDMASNGTAEVDLSGTGVIAYSGVEDFAGGILFNDKATNTLTGINIGDVMNNFDGLSRRDRIRYDTPSFGGFQLSTSAGDNGRWDGAARYKGDFGDVAFEAAAAYSNDDNDNGIIDGSFSLLHKTSGISLTAAAGTVDLDDSTDPRDPMSYYVKLGWQTKNLTPLGKTAFAIDYSYNEDVFVLDGEAEAYGIFMVQNLDRVGTELYAGIRNHEYKAPGVNVDDVLGVMFGARVKF